MTETNEYENLNVILDKWVYCELTIHKRRKKL